MNIILKYIYIGLIVFGSIGALAFTKNSFKEEKSFKNGIEKVGYKPIVVLELFTSQGCSSCPSADLLLQNVKQEFEEEVFALSYHVDYWNYIGWKDPFSKVEFGIKQRQYNAKFKNRSNYTPQLVVNGKEHFVGSNSLKMYNKIRAYGKKEADNKIELDDLLIDKNSISFNFDVQGSLDNKVLRTLLVLDERTTEVKRGENRNRTLHNSNIVVAEQSLLLEEANSAMEISIPAIVSKSDKLNLIVLVENSDFDITAAAKQRLVR